MTWIVPPKSYYVDFTEDVMTDGTKKTFFANGTIIKETPPPPPDATEKDKAFAVLRLVDFGNGTQVISYFNGTVAMFDQGNFARYIVPPKSFFVDMQVF